MRCLKVLSIFWKCCLTFEGVVHLLKVLFDFWKCCPSSESVLGLLKVLSIFWKCCLFSESVGYFLKVLSIFRKRCRLPLTKKDRDLYNDSKKLQNRRYKLNIVCFIASLTLSEAYTGIEGHYSQLIRLCLHAICGYDSQLCAAIITGLCCCNNNPCLAVVTGGMRILFQYSFIRQKFIYTACLLVIE